MTRTTRWLTALSVAVTSCSGAHRPVERQALAPRCEIHHTLRGPDELITRIDRLPDGWLVSLRLRVRMSPDEPVTGIRGLGRVARLGDESRCEVIEAGSEPGQPRFDAAICLDEAESVAELLSEAEQTARPGETVVQEVRLRGRRRRRRARARTSVVLPSNFQERAEVTRDVLGRVVRLVRSAPGGAREEIEVRYPAGMAGYCLPPQ